VYLRIRAPKKSQSGAKKYRRHRLKKKSKVFFCVFAYLFSRQRDHSLNTP
jgi:hypothetical protein